MEAVTGPDLLGCCSLIKIEMMKYWNENFMGGGGGGGAEGAASEKCRAVCMLFK